MTLGSEVSLRPKLLQKQVVRVEAQRCGSAYRRISTASRRQLRKDWWPFRVRAPIKTSTVLKQIRGSRRARLGFERCSNITAGFPGEFVVSNGFGGLAA